MTRNSLVLLMVLFQLILHSFTFISTKDKNGNASDASYLVTATVYHSDPRQCDADYHITADGSEIDTTNPSKHRWVAVSRDMLLRNGGRLQFGDSIRIEGTNSHLDGIHVVRDVMNKRYQRCVDFLVSKNDIYGRWERVRLHRL